MKIFNKVNLHITEKLFFFLEENVLTFHYASLVTSDKISCYFTFTFWFKGHGENSSKEAETETKIACYHFAFVYFS